VNYAIKTIHYKNLLFACSDSEYRSKIESFIDKAFSKSNPNLVDVCRRYARNIMNGRWLWRNLILGETSIVVKIGPQKLHSKVVGEFSSFDNYTEEEDALANALINGFFSEGGSAAPISVTADVLFGVKGSTEVFPSQNMVTNKPKGFARSLYKINRPDLDTLRRIMYPSRGGAGAFGFMADIVDVGFAALRDQKIGNAIRTIDTWYEGSNNATPIPLEPNGANIERNLILRSSSNDARTYFLPSRLDTIDPTKDNDVVKFMIGVLIRGGVLSGKKDKDAP